MVLGTCNIFKVGTWLKNVSDPSKQQSQLSHYPERKIAEFQFCIEGLEKEYKRFLSKLRALDPSCKHQPWTPRAYAKKREDPLRSVGYGQSASSLALWCSTALSHGIAVMMSPSSDMKVVSFSFFIVVSTYSLLMGYIYI